MASPQIFLAPCASKRPQDHFERTIVEGVRKGTYGEYTDFDFGDRIGVWGVIEGNVPIWNRIESGDYLLFYFGNEEYRYGAQVVETEHNREFAIDLWPAFEDASGGGGESAQPWEYLIYLEEPFRIDIDSSEIHGFAGHKSNYPQKFTPLNEEALETIENEFGGVESYINARRPTPSVWIEKTEVEGRQYKQEGPLALGNALIAPSRDEGGRKRYETLREADVGDVVLHLLQERDEIVGVSRIASELQEDFEGPPDDRWSQEQFEQGGYKRELADFTELDDPIDIYDDVLDRDHYRDQLHEIKEQHEGKIIYNKRLALNQGHYFTAVPTQFLSILATESDDLPKKLTAFGVEISNFPSDLPPSVDSYQGISAAMTDIQTRLEVSNRSNWIGETFPEAILEDWSDVLTNFGPNTEVSPEDEIRFHQIRQVFENNVSRLKEQAAQLGSGTLHSLTESQTLFTVLLRDLQESAGLNTNANHVKLHLILNQEYETGSQSPVSHTLLRQLTTSPQTTPVRKFTAPPDYWLTAIQYGAVAIEGTDNALWEDIESGEIIFLHSDGEPGVEGLSTQPSGILGVGIVGETSTKEEPWWSHETRTDLSPYLITFERLFVTADIESLDLATPVADQSITELESQLQILTSGIFESSDVQSICQSTNGIGFPAQGDHAVFRDENDEIDHARPRALLETVADRLTEIGAINSYAPFAGSLTTELLSGLHFQEGTSEAIIEQIEAALRSGKHIILTGPPGTGKTEIARRVCSYLSTEFPYLYSDFQLTTATADWSTFDTVGGYMPEESATDGQDLSFTPGVVLNRLKDSQTNRQINEPIVIDELNRADIDKAFGQLFTLLSGQSVQLPYTLGGHEVELLSTDQIDTPPKKHQYVVPESWRIFATMNTYDKTSLYEMSYAFMRRFAFIRIAPPTLPDSLDDEASRDELDQLMHEYAEIWEIDIGPSERLDVGRVWRAMNQSVEDRAIGPAIIRDIMGYIVENDQLPFENRLTRSIISYIFPQLEGVPKREQILKEIADVPRVNESLINEAAIDMLQVNIRRDE